MLDIMILVFFCGVKLTESRSVNKEAVKAALQNLPPMVFPIDDPRNNKIFRQQYPNAVFDDYLYNEQLRANQMNSPDRNDPGISSEKIDPSEPPSAHATPGNMMTEDYMSPTDNDDSGRTGDEGEAGWKFSDLSHESYDQDGMRKSLVVRPALSMWGDEAENGDQGYTSRTVAVPYDIMLKSDTFVLEPDSEDGIPTYRVSLEFEGDELEVEYEVHAWKAN